MKKLIIIATLMLWGTVVFASGPAVKRYDDTARPVIAAKGTWSIGGNAAFTSHTNTNYSFPAVEGVNSVGFRVSASPQACWFFQNNLGVGIKAEYGRSMLSIGDASASIGSVSLGVKDYNTVREDLSFTAFLRYLIPVGDSRRVVFHVDGGIKGYGGEAKVSEEHTGNVRGSWLSRWDAAFVVDPGITIFLGSKTAIRASVGLVEISKKNRREVHNQVAEGSIGSFSASLLPDLAGLSIGIDFYPGRK